MDMDRKDASATASAGNGALSSPGGLRRAVVVAGHQHDAATPRAHLDNGDPAVRAAALGALERTGDLGPDDLIEAARDPEPTVRRRVAELAALLGARSSDVTTQQVVTDGVLLVLLADEDAMVVEVAAFALGELPLADEPEGVGGGEASGDGVGAAPRRVAALAEVATDHRDALCREAAVAALGAIGHPAGLPAVLTGSGDRASVRRRAVLALSAFDDKRVTTMLEKLERGPRPAGITGSRRPARDRIRPGHLNHAVPHHTAGATWSSPQGQKTVTAGAGATCALRTGSHQVLFSSSRNRPRRSADQLPCITVAVLDGSEFVPTAISVALGDPETLYAPRILGPVGLDLDVWSDQTERRGIQRIGRVHDACTVDHIGLLEQHPEVCAESPTNRGDATLELCLIQSGSSALGLELLDGILFGVGRVGRVQGGLGLDGADTGLTGDRHRQVACTGHRDERIDIPGVGDERECLRARRSADADDELISSRLAERGDRSLRGGTRQRVVALFGQRSRSWFRRCCWTARRPW